MAIDFNPLNDLDTKELRKEIGLPITKGLIYWYKDVTNNSWKQSNICDYQIVDVYMPSGSKSLMITLEDGRKIRILADYLVEMQKATFLNDVNFETEENESVSGTIGSRIDKDIDSYVVVDIETTGLSPDQDEIIEIGAIKYDKGKEIECFQTFIKTDNDIPINVEKLTGISKNMITNYGVDLKEACMSFKKFVGDMIIVGHNFTSFDSKFLENAYVSELKCHFSNDYIDTLYLAKKKKPKLDHYSMESLANEYNIDYSKAHRALEDCRINHYIYEIFTFGVLISESNETNNNCKLVNSIIENDDDLIELDVLEGWQARISSKFSSLEKEYGLFEHSFSVMTNKGKEGNVTSYAICVYEPDLIETRRESSRNTVLARVKELNLKSDSSAVDVFSKKFVDIDKKRMNKESDEFIDCLVDCIKFGISNYAPKAESFACCSRYQECSNDKKCIHPNKLYAKACKYRRNIEDGHIFY